MGKREETGRWRADGAWVCSISAIVHAAVCVLFVCLCPLTFLPCAQ